jgi:hypothetical protein
MAVAPGGGIGGEFARRIAAALRQQYQVSPPNWGAVFPRTGAVSPGAPGVVSPGAPRAASAEQLMKMRPNYRRVALPGLEPLPTVGDPAAGGKVGRQF